MGEGKPGMFIEGEATTARSAISREIVGGDLSPRGTDSAVDYRRIT